MFWLILDDRSFCFRFRHNHLLPVCPGKSAVISSR
uniref:Uncharacterized protein n=1 Tax=Anguilla anguilla TaxID=7936 RepID=A0A0E9VPE9_ANGAN